uniref:Sm domain-containing protein n=1 Tax=Strigamia maritima TaxID=126957 RepID=T1J0V0_STRMM
MAPLSGAADIPKSLGHRQLESWLNKSMKIEMTDGRTLIGTFLCTDRDCNVILGSCSEYLCADEGGTEDEPRVLGLAMIPGHHIVSICLDKLENVKGDIL